MSNDQDISKKRNTLTRKNILPGILYISIILISAFIFLNFNFYRTLFSLRKINPAPVYEFTMHHDYGFDSYLKVGAATEKELVDFFFGRRKPVKNPAFPGSGCSAFLARTPEGDIILGRNMDWHSALPAIMHTRSKLTGKCIALTNLNYSGIVRLTDNIFDSERRKLHAAPYMTLDGMNEHGLAANIFTAKGSISSIDPDKITLWDITVIRAILDHATTTREAIDFLSNYNVAFTPEWPSQYMVADAAGNSAIIEFVKGEMKVLENAGSTQVCTNFIIYDNPSLTGFGDYRYRTIARQLESQGGIITTKDAIKLLQENVIHNQGQWSAVYNLTKKTVTAVFAGDYASEFVRKIE